MGRAAQRAVLRPDQHAPDRCRGAYIVDNSGAKAIVGSAKMRDVLAGLGDELPNGLPDTLLIADGDLDGWLRYPEAVADLPDTPIDDELDGDLLQYSSGTTPAQGHQT